MSNPPLNFFLKIPITEFRILQYSPGLSSYLKVLSLDTFAKTLIPNKVIFTNCRDKCRGLTSEITTWITYHTWYSPRKLVSESGGWEDFFIEERDWK